MEVGKILLAHIVGLVFVPEAFQEVHCKTLRETTKKGGGVLLM